MQTDVVLKNICDKSLILTLNQPEKRNAFNPQMIEALVMAYEHVDSSCIHRVVLKANGKHFSAGADLNWMRAQGKQDKAQNIADAKYLNQLMSAIKNCVVPTIAVVQGAVVGGGVGLVAASDIVIADLTAWFCLSETKLGLIPAVISPYVASAIGKRQYLAHALLADKISAEHAKDMGLVTQLVEEGILDASLDQLLQSMKKNSSDAQIACKKLLHTLENTAAYDVANITAEAIATQRATDDAQARMQQFLEKK